MSKLQKWQILNSKMVLDHPWCQVRQDEVKLPNGTVIDDYFVNIRPDIVLVLPIQTWDGRFLFRTASRQI